MTEIDINDAFEDILFTEEKIIEESYKQGFKEGEHQGNPEAYHLGYHRGAEIGAELGYYLGTLESLDLEQCNEKITQILTSLKPKIITFPKENIEEDYLEELNNIRANYKKLCALLKIDSSWPEADKLNF